MTAWRLCPAQDGDSESLYQLHRLTMRAYVEQTYGPWDESVQRWFHHRWFRPELTGQRVRYRSRNVMRSCISVGSLFTPTINVKASAPRS
jgi:hypothetical protein